MSALDKITLLALDNSYTDTIQNIVFSSRFGEVDRLLKIIDQYTQDNEVSPNTFSSSVHNYPVSFFLLNKRHSIPYTALSAHKNSISSGLLASLVSDYDNVLFCYSDVNNGIENSLAINISKKYHEDSTKYILKLQSNSNMEDSFDNHVKLFSGIISSVRTSSYTIERLGE